MMINRREEILIDSVYAFLWQTTEAKTIFHPIVNMILFGENTNIGLRNLDSILSDRFKRIPVKEAHPGDIILFMNQFKDAIPGIIAGYNGTFIRFEWPTGRLRVENYNTLFWPIISKVAFQMDEETPFQKVAKPNNIETQKREIKDFKMEIDLSMDGKKFQIFAHDGKCRVFQMSFPIID